MTDVTIRGIDDSTYAEFAAEAKRRGLSIGELTTAAMRTTIEQAAGPSYRIGDVEELTVSRKDLESLEGTVTLEHIELLSFDETVDWQTFNKRIQDIKDVELVMLPKTLTKFQVLTKSRNVELILSKK